MKLGYHSITWGSGVVGDGIVDLDRRSADEYGAAFVDLDAEQQDRVLTAIERPGESSALNTAQSVSGTPRWSPRCNRSASRSL